MVYIVVGVDGTGKTSSIQLLKEYCKRFRYPIHFIKESYTASKIIKHKRVQRVREFVESGHDVVFDRATLIDDLVYNQIVANRTPDILSDTAAFILNNCTVIYLECDDAILKKRLADRGDEYVSLKDIPKLKEAYKRLFANCGIKPYYIDTTNLSLKETFEQLKGIICHKQMKLAHIVPVRNLEILDQNQYLMCLAHLVKENDEYAQYYKSAASDPGKFVLMDNGAAENSQLSNKALYECYELIQPDELVLPDVLCDAENTIVQMRKALVYFDKKHVSCRYMAVPQGKTLEEWTKCADTMLRTKRINTIGVSKFLQIQIGDIGVRIAALKSLTQLIKKHRRYDIEVHLLGCSERPWVIAKARRDCPFVRGCDSAYGYLCAQAGVEVFDNIDRPEGEIDFINGASYSNLENTLSQLELACNVSYNGIDQTWSMD